MPPSPSGKSLDYTQFQKKMASLPTEIEVLQIQNKKEIEQFKKVWMNQTAGLSKINQELGIEIPTPDVEFYFHQGPNKIESQKHYSQDIFWSSPEFIHPNNNYIMPLFSPPPPSITASVKQHVADIEDTINTDDFVFGIDDLKALAFYLKVDYNKLLNAAMILRNNGTLENDDDDEVIPCSQSPKKSSDFWKERMSQTQSFIGK